MAKPRSIAWFMAQPPMPKTDVHAEIQMQMQGDATGFTCLVTVLSNWFN